MAVTMAVAIVLSLLLAACGGDDSAMATSAARPTTAPAVTEAALAPGPTDAPIVTPPTATPEPTEPEPTATAPPAHSPEPTTEPRATATPREPDPTATPREPDPTETPGEPDPTATPREPDRTAAPSPTAPPAESCQGDRGGEVGNCAPEFAGTQGWINSEPLNMESLRGKVVLIDFWTYSCINCIRTLPYLQDWHQRYADAGLVMIGVHTPEFEFEKVYDNVVDATVDMGVAWPVVQDNDFVVWDSYSNRFWPAKYLIDQHGEIRYRHFGEGKYAETEEQIRSLLAEIGAEAEMLAQPLPEDQQRDSTYVSERTRQRTPELFAGWRFTTLQGRGGIGQQETYAAAAQVSYRRGDQTSEIAEFQISGRDVVIDHIYFQGPWAIGPEHARHARETEDIEQDFVLLPYSSRSVNAVLSSESGDAYKVVVKLNNQYLTEENKGEDITIGEDGESYLMVDSARAYYLVEHPEWQENQYIQLFSNSDDFSLFSFTFGTYEDGF